MNNLLNPVLLLRYATMALIGLLPFLVIPASWATTIQSKLLLVGLVVICAVIAWGYARYSDGAIEFPRSPLALAVVALPIVYIISAVLSGGLAGSFASGTGEQDTVSSIALFAALFFLAAIVFRGKEDALSTFFRPFLAGSLVFLSIQVLHVLFPSLTFGVLTGAATSVFGSWHEVGIIAGLLFFVVWGLQGTSVVSGVWKWVAYAIGALSALMLVIVNMADVWLAFGVLMLAYAAHRWYVSRAKGPALRPIMISAAVGLVAIGAGFAGSYIFDALPARLQVLQVEVRPSWSGTFAIGQESMQGLTTTLFGSGPNTFAKQWSLYKPVGVNSTEFWNVDFNAGVGFIPTTFVTVGILGLLAWGSLVLLLVWRFVRTLRPSVSASLSDVQIVLIGSGLYLIVFHILYVPTISLSALTFLFLGVLVSQEGVYKPWKISFSPQDKWGLARGVVAGSVLLMFVVAGLYTIRATISELLINKSVVAYNEGKGTEGSLALIQAALLVDSSNDRGHRAAVELGLIRLGELNAAGDTSEAAVAQLQTSLQTTIQHGLEAVSINSGDYRNWLALASLYRDLAGAGVQGAYDNARAAYERAYADNPNNPLPLVQMAQLDVAQNNLDQALALLTKAIELKPNLAAAYLLRAQAFALQGNEEGAVGDAASVVQLAPEDPLGWYTLGAILYDTERFREASQALERAVALQSDYANALFVLGLSYDKLGRTSEALAVLEQVATKNPSDQNLLKVISDIRASVAAGNTESEDTESEE